MSQAIIIVAVRLPFHWIALVSMVISLVTANLPAIALVGRGPALAPLNHRCVHGVFIGVTHDSW